MKILFWISVALLLLGLLGIFMNIYTGLFLTKNQAAESDFHLIVALISVGVMVIGSIGLIQSSQKLLSESQEKILLSKKQSSGGLLLSGERRSKAVSASIFLIVCCVINLISGTISQAGRFPLIHGLFGFVLAGLAIAASIAWISFGLSLTDSSRS
ncbi:MAG: hypothetical protein JWQ35_1099 [Bacteriovoracaceae bacterium]|nr:hypothetical protein [Bacteriovoracaceae bacterium]